MPRIASFLLATLLILAGLLLTPAASSTGPHSPPALFPPPDLLGGGWSDVNGGVNGAANAVAIGPDGAVYVAGLFTQAGGLGTTPASYVVAKWDGTTWTLLGGGNDWIFALHVRSDGVLYAGGRFTEIGGVAATRIAYYDPGTDTWSPIGVGFNNPVQVIAEGPDNCLYAGGGFRIVGDTSGQNLARTCTENVWEYVGSGTSDAVSDLAFDGDYLYVGGTFGTVGSGLAANRIARYDLSTGAWSAVGGGVTQVGGGPTIYALEFAPNGDLYAGGDFTSIGGVNTTGLARWDGTSWHAIGGGVSGSTGGSTSVRDLLFDAAGQLYIGGSFTQAGAVDARAVARWTGSAWDALDVGVTNGVVETLGISFPYLYAGGGYSDMGGNATLDFLAKWEGDIASAGEPPAPLASVGLTLGPAVPNPSSGGATLRFTSAQTQTVRLEVFDALGRRLATLFDGPLAAEQTVTVSVPRLPAGTYLARLTGESGTAVQRFQRVL